MRRTITRLASLGTAAALGMTVLTAAALADPFGPVPGRESPAASATPSVTSSVFIGVMGQVARPGVYECNAPRPTLAEVLRRAGGLTQRATGAVRIVRGGRAGQQFFFDHSDPIDPHDPSSSNPLADSPLLDGDILVADAAHTGRPDSRAAARDAEPEPIPVALVGVLERPVILPVPPNRAHAASVLAFLGQDLELASEVQVLTVGRAAGASIHPQAGPWFRSPTVLEFSPRSISRESLPELPAAFAPPGETDVPNEPDPLALSLEAGTATVGGPPRPLLPVPSLPTITIEPEREPDDAASSPERPKLSGPTLPIIAAEPPAAEPAEPPAAEPAPVEPTAATAAVADSRPKAEAAGSAPAKAGVRAEKSAGEAAWLAVGIGAVSLGLMLLVFRSQHRLAATRKAGAAAEERDERDKVRRFDSPPHRMQSRPPHFQWSERPARAAASVPAQDQPPQPAPLQLTDRAGVPANPPTAPIPIRGLGRIDQALVRLDGDGFRRAA